MKPTTIAAALALFAGLALLAVDRAQAAPTPIPQEQVVVPPPYRVLLLRNQGSATRSIRSFKASITEFGATTQASFDLLPGQAAVLPALGSYAYSYEAGLDVAILPASDAIEFEAVALELRCDADSESGSVMAYDYGLARRAGDILHVHSGTGVHLPINAWSAYLVSAEVECQVVAAPR